MKKQPLVHLYSLLFVFAFATQTEAQSISQIMFHDKKNEVCLGLGASNFLGELGGANRIGSNYFRDFDIQSTRPAFSAGYRIRFSEDWASKTSIFTGWLFGNDKYTKEEARSNRNLSFRSFIVELSSQIEWYFLKEERGHKYNIRGVSGLKGFPISGYLFAGVGGFFFNPKAKLNGTWYALQPLGTEGQGLVDTRKKYSRFNVAIPVGIGFNYRVDRDLRIGLEYGIRKTFTDYIDDVSLSYYDNNVLKQKRGEIAAQLADRSLGKIPGASAPNEQRGDPRDKDSYMFLNITLNYRLEFFQRTLPKFF